MLTPAHVNIVSFFYPIGNTPAVCLTQDLTREEKANVLLLGCGDVRNILFTTYADVNSKRSLDITCCDVEAAVLARNILLLTLLLDDDNGTRERHIWNIYYHVYLDKTSLDIVRSQAQTLFMVSTSLETWGASRYGRLLRFCDLATLREVREIWYAYDGRHRSKTAEEHYQQRFRMDIKRARDRRLSMHSRGGVLTGLRSAAPTMLESLQDLPKLYDHFWDHGVMDTLPEDWTLAKHANPMFASLPTDNFTLHYGTDPILGFHLATAYVPLTSDSPLHAPAHAPVSEQSRLNKLVEAAQSQFRAWSQSFRRYASQDLMIRVIAADALNLCHTLRHPSPPGESDVRWYRRQGSLEPLILGSDYATKSISGPRAFNVIDTSNLVDVLGAINLVTAVSPLLDGSLSATMYTESLVRHAKDQRAMIDSLICGHFPTMSVLCGLIPVEFWTNATTLSTAEEETLDLFDGSLNEKTTHLHNGQMYSKLSWKRPIHHVTGMSQMISVTSVRLDEMQLASVLYDVYEKMFWYEDMSLMFSELDTSILKDRTRSFYHRGTLVAFISFIKERVVVADWDKVLQTLLVRIEKSQNIPMGANHIQEFYTQLLLLDVYPAAALRSPSPRQEHPDWKGLPAWKDIPAVVCITLSVPRVKLKVFTDLSEDELATPGLHCLVQSCQASAANGSNGWQNMFEVVQLSFGEVTTTGSRDDSNFKVEVKEDRHGWKGSSPLLLTFEVPSCTLLIEGDATTVAFGINSSPRTAATFIKSLGIEMVVYATTAGDTDHVFIAKSRPCEREFPVFASPPKPTSIALTASGNSVRSVITANIDGTTHRIRSLTGRLDIISEAAKAVLRTGCAVETAQISPFIISVVYGPSAQAHYLRFPAPVLQGRSKCRIARKSSYIEVEVPLAIPPENRPPSNLLFPVFACGREPVVWNLRRLDLDRLPKIDITKAKGLQWMITHASLMMSARERKLREESMTSGTEQNDVRINFKDSLFSLLMHSTGLQGRRGDVFGINNPGRGGVHILIFISSLRLNLSDRTVVLDAVILPLRNEIMSSLGSFLAGLQSKGFINIQVNDAEMELWKQVLPAMVERCRAWTHRSRCEYLGHPCIPLSVRPGEAAICRCGNGTVPSDLITGVPGWDTACKHAVRAAISPFFTPSYVEPVHDETDRKKIKTLQSGLSCATCGRRESSNGCSGLLKCARCHQVRYCSAACQRTNWPHHKRVCGRQMKEERESAR